MITHPSFGRDLQAEIDEAVANKTPNALLKEEYRFGDTTLLEAAVVQRRFDYAKKLLSIGATMTTETLRSVIYWYCGAAMVVLLLEHGTLYDADCEGIAATRNEDWETVFVLLDYGADIETWGEGAPLLHIMVWSGKSKGQYAAQNLLARGANVNSFDARGMTPLMKACDTSNPVRWEDPHVQENMENLLLEHGADVFHKNKWGETALLLCTRGKTDASKQRAKTVEKLLRRGADPNEVSPQGTTPLMFAARDDDALLARALLRGQADKSIKTPDGRTARDIAEQYGSQAVLALLF